MNMKTRLARLEHHQPTIPVLVVVIMNPAGEYSLDGVPITPEKLDEIGRRRPVRIVHILNAPASPAG